MRRCSGLVYRTRTLHHEKYNQLNENTRWLCDECLYCILSFDVAVDSSLPDMPSCSYMTIVFQSLVRQ